MSGNLAFSNSTATNEVHELTANELELIAGAGDWSFFTSATIVAAGYTIGGPMGALFALGVVDGHNDKY